jgi:hypothetical protein
MAAKKKVAKKKAKKKPARSPRDAFDANLKSIQDQLPPALARRVRDLRKSMRDLEKGIDKARADREKRWHHLETSIRKDAAQVLRRLEHAIEPAKPKRKKKATKKKAAAKK